MWAADEAAAAAASDAQGTDSDSAPDTIGWHDGAAADEALAARGALLKAASRSSRKADAASTDPRTCCRTCPRSRLLGRVLLQQGARCLVTTNWTGRGKLQTETVRTSHD